MAFRPSCAADAPKPAPEPAQEPYRPAPFWRLFFFLPVPLFWVCALVLAFVLLGGHLRNVRAENCAVGYFVGYILCWLRGFVVEVVYKR